MISFFKHLSVFIISLFFLGILIFAFFFHFTKIEKIDLKIDSQSVDFHISEKTKKKIISELTIYKGKKIWQVDLDNIASKISKNYPALNVHIVRQIPNHIIVFLKQRGSAALLLKDSGGLYTISFDGKLQNQLKTYQALDLPILTGKEFIKNQSLRKKAIQLLSHLPERGLISSYNTSEVIYNKKNSSFLLILVSNNFTIELVDKASPKRLNEINFVLNYLIQKNIKRSRVDARFDKKIIVNTYNSF